ncbi:DcaP family trimeric outer membrane transporter [Algiphilus sp.]|uniref:DcaP family trimeric outer membrane transporter n=1 Tax=Algiphilus sp. TaxID=1872431 RepID=UPI001CA7A1C0|nr:DcaP family trimeric outer membrane transporter [Algiphilus sp.]MBY8966384.1 hypothetical protein [Algiphilus acroporae]MCI5062163.1 DcaP family trimeric outer membrane transporter [Algiphilus sp.]MCI5102180.1 DcaP family trimeric outer membrane transporter [Algiphilus sp.]
MTFKRLAVAALAASGLAASGTASAISAQFGDTEFSLGGYIKLDALYTNYSVGPVPSNRGRQFTIPSIVPVGDGDSEGALDLSARESRFNFKTVTTTDRHRFTSFIELDFLDAAFDGDLANEERLVNGSNPRLRHAFVSWGMPTGGELLLGQTWSTFMELAAYPDLLDFIGPAQGMTFIRQPMVRYTRGRLQVALENPDATIQGNVNTGQAGGFVDQSELPDLTAKMQLVASDRTLLTLAGLVRQIDAGNSADTGDDTAMGYGVSLSGRQKFGMDDIRFQFNFGDGIGRYLGLNAARGAVLDDNGELETIQAMGGYVAYRHFWSQRWRSNIALGYFSADNETRFSGEAVTETISSAQANLLYSPVTAFTIGGELMFHQRELENGADGHQTRLQFSAKYAF